MVGVAEEFGAEKNRSYADMVRVLTFMDELNTVRPPHPFDFNTQKPTLLQIFNPNKTAKMQPAKIQIADLEENQIFLSYINNLLYPSAKATPKDYIVAPRVAFWGDLYNLVRKTPKR